MFLIHWSQDHENALADFDKYLGILKRRPRTADAYVSGARDFLRCTQKGLDELTEDDVFQYLVDLKEQRGLGASTLNQRRSALSSFFSNILERPLSKKVLRSSKRVKRLPETLTVAEVTNLFRATDNLKHQTIFMTMYSAGLRIGEAIHLKPLDINSKSMQVHIREAKGQKDRNVMLSEKLLDQLRRYWKIYRPKGWLFPSTRSSGPVHSRTIQKAFKEVAQQSGIRRSVTPHCLRHSFATHLLEAGVSLPYIQQLLGHASINTTMIYLRVAPKSAGVTSPLDRIVLCTEHERFSGRARGHLPRVRRDLPAELARYRAAVGCHESHRAVQNRSARRAYVSLRYL